MLDTIHLSSSTEQVPDSHKLSKALDCTIVNIPSSAYYSNGIGITPRDNPEQFLVIKWGARRSASPMRIEVNPSQFPNLRSLRGLLSFLFDDPDLLQVRRADHCVDVEIPVEQIFKTLAMTRKRVRETYKQDKLTGFYLGNWPETLCCYDKYKQLTVKARKQKYLKSMSDPNVIKCLTRLELRQDSYKVPIKTFDQITELAQYEPFKALSFFDVDTKTTNQKEVSKALLLKSMVDELGLQGAIKSLNHHSNFLRDFNKVLTKKVDVPDLNHLYQQQVLNFIGGKDGYN